MTRYAIILFLLVSVLGYSQIGKAAVYSGYPPTVYLEKLGENFDPDGSFDVRAYLKFSGKAIGLNEAKIKLQFKYGNNSFWSDAGNEQWISLDDSGCDFFPDASRYVCSFTWKMPQLCISGGFGNGCGGILDLAQALVDVGLKIRISDDGFKTASKPSDVHDCYRTTENPGQYLPTFYDQFCKNKSIQSISLHPPNTYQHCPYGFKTSSGACTVCEDGKELIENHVGQKMCVTKCEPTVVNNIKQKNLELDEKAPSFNVINQLLSIYVLTLGIEEKIQYVDDGIKLMDYCPTSDGSPPSFQIVPVGGLLGVVDLNFYSELMQNSCTEKGTYWNFNDETFECSLECPEDLTPSSNGMSCEQEISCPSNKKWVSPNTCVCKDEIVGADPATCECVEGETKGYDFDKAQFACAKPEEPPVTECTSTADCSDGKTCKNGVCISPVVVNKDFGDACSSSEECTKSNGLICYNGGCSCDLDNGYSINQLTGSGCVKAELTCEGENINGKCILNPSEAKCLKKGMLWKNDACVEKPFEATYGSGCSVVSGPISANGVAQMLIYLALLLVTRISYLVKRIS